jgi:hypothetical protein
MVFSTLLLSVLHLCLQGLVPPYLNAYFSYITELEACHCPDYQYLLSLLQVTRDGNGSQQPVVCHSLL